MKEKIKLLENEEKILICCLHHSRLLWKIRDSGSFENNIKLMPENEIVHKTEHFCRKYIARASLQHGHARHPVTTAVCTDQRRERPRGKHIHSPASKSPYFFKTMNKNSFMPNGGLQTCKIMGIICPSAGILESTKRTQRFGNWMLPSYSVGSLRNK